MEALILAIVIAYAVKKAAEDAHNHWQGAKSANRASTRGQPARQRIASAGRHDTAYWAEQVRGGFPQVRHGLFMGWHAGRVAQLEGREARARARADHAETRARVTEAVREQRRRQDEALDRIRAAAAQPEPEPEAAEEPESWVEDTRCPRCGRIWPLGYEGNVCPGCRGDDHIRRLRGDPPAGDNDSTPATTPTEGNTMPGSGDTTYRQQMAELQAIRGDAEAEVNDVRRKRMMNRLDVLMSLGLDKQTIDEAAAIDDALREQEKAAQQTLDATDAAISGLSKRHGGIQEAVDSAPVDKPAEPEFYTD